MGVEKYNKGFEEAVQLFGPRKEKVLRERSCSEE
jgi:hypothetical protein